MLLAQLALKVIRVLKVAQVLLAQPALKVQRALKVV